MGTTVNTQDCPDAESECSLGGGAGGHKPLALPPSTLRQRLKQSLDDGDFCDVTFLVGETRTQFDAHRVILAAASPVFRAMFVSPLTHGTSCHELPDIEPGAFRNLLGFAYTDSTDGVDDGSVFHTLYTAKKYMVEGLANACCEYLRQHLTIDNALTVLEHCMFLQVPSVVQPCLRLICHQWERVSTCGLLLDCSPALVCLVLTQDSLPCDEAEVFDWLLRWADSRVARGDNDAEVEDDEGKSVDEVESDDEASVKDVAKGVELAALPGGGDSSDQRRRQRRRLLAAASLLRCVRFPRMSHRQIGRLVAPAGLLSSRQLVEIFTWMPSDSTDDSGCVCGEGFSARPRCPTPPGEPEQLSLCDLASAAVALARTDSPRGGGGTLAAFPTARTLALPPTATVTASTALTSTTAAGTSALEVPAPMGGAGDSVTIAASASLTSLASSLSVFGGLDLRPNHRLLLLGCHLFRQQQYHHRLRHPETSAASVAAPTCVSAEVCAVDDPELRLLRLDEGPLTTCPTTKQTVSLTEVTFGRALVLLPGRWYRLTLYVRGSPPPPCLWSEGPWELEARSGARLELRQPDSALVPYAAFVQGLTLCWLSQPGE